MPDVVALELEAGAVGLAEVAQDVFDVLEGVPEDEVPAVLQVLALPVVLELRVAVEHRVQPEVHRAHVERAHLRLRAHRAGEPFLQGHPVSAAGGDVHHRVAALLDAGQELHEHVRARRRAAVLGVARMEVDDGGARLRRLDGLLRDLRRRQRQVRGHRRGVDRPGGRTRDDHLLLLRCHAGSSLCGSRRAAVARRHGFAPTMALFVRPIRAHHAINAHDRVQDPGPRASPSTRAATSRSGRGRAPASPRRACRLTIVRRWRSGSTPIHARKRSVAGWSLIHTGSGLRPGGRSAPPRLRGERVPCT